MAPEHRIGSSEQSKDQQDMMHIDIQEMDESIARHIEQDKPPLILSFVKSYRSC